MGIETAILVAAAATAVESGFQVAAASEKERSLQLQQQQSALQTQQRTLSNLDVMEKTLQAQIAHNTVSGTSASSPSFNAIQRNTLNIGARQAKNIETEGSIANANIEAEKENVRNTLYAQLFGNVANVAFSAASVKKSAASVKKSAPT